MNVGGIILCGGKSSRMGTPKAMLPFGPERMLQRVVRILGEVASPLVVVAADAQELPELPSEVLVVRDEHPERGPLEGLAAGLAAIIGKCDAVYVTSCDVPLLKSEFVRAMMEKLGDYQIAVPKDDFYHPLAGVYRLEILETVRQMLASNQRRMSDLFAEVATLAVPVSELKSVDSQLLSLMNLNERSDYLAAVRIASFESDFRDA